MLKDKTFILGVGAQRAGTTWLSYYLRKRPDVFISPIKELHFFDQKFRPDLCGNFSEQFARQLNELVDPNNMTEADLKKPRVKRLLDRLEMDQDDRAYLRYFSERLSGIEKALGEITPSYCLIGEKGFSFVKSLLESEGLKVKIVFLMRDPVERYYSALCKKERDTQGRFSAFDHFLLKLDDPSYRERTRYDRICNDLMAVFDRKDIFFGFYENLFTESAIKQFCHVLGLKYLAANFTRIKNPSQRIMPLDDDMIRSARKGFDPVYKYCREIFGDMVPQKWH